MAVPSDGSGGSRCQSYGGDYGANVGLEEVCAHTCNVAYVVADVVGYYGGIAGVVLGDSGFDLANQVGADIGGLGVDAATHPSEQGDGGGPETEPHYVIYVLIDEVKDGDTEEANAHHSDAHDSTAGKRQRAGRD